MTDMQIDPQPTLKTTFTVLTRQCEAGPEFNYILLSVEMEPLADPKADLSIHQRRLQAYNLPILTFRKMLSSALQDLFGAAVGGGIAVDILAYATPSDLEQPPSNNTILLAQSPFAILVQQQQQQQASSSSSTTTATTATTAVPAGGGLSCSSSRTTAWAILRCHAQDLQPLWNALTLFNSTVDDLDVRIQVRRTAATLLALASSSRGYAWDQAPSFPSP